MQQLTLGLSRPASYAPEDFIITPANREAWSWIQLWPAWNGRILALYGPAGSGKTHLAHCWLSGGQGYLFSEEELARIHPRQLLQMGERLVFKYRRGALPAEPLFHLINLVREQSAGLLILSENAPARWDVALPDLASRLRAIPAVELTAPDEELLVAVIAKRFADLELRVPAEVVRYIVQHVPRTFAAVQQVVLLVDRLSLEAKKNITVPFVRQVLQAHGLA